MQNLRNRVQLIGRLGQDPEVRTLTSGKKLTTFSVATTDSYRNSSGDKVEETQWHNIVAWGKVGEIAGEYLTKGQEVALLLLVLFERACVRGVENKVRAETGKDKGQGRLRLCG